MFTLFTGQLPNEPIPQGKRATLERIALHIIHVVHLEDDTGGKQGPRDPPEDHAAPGSVGNWSVCRPLY